VTDDDDDDDPDVIPNKIYQIAVHGVTEWYDKMMITDFQGKSVVLIDSCV
jgi:hypothetical protein